MEHYLGIKKEQTTDTCYNMDKPQKCYAKWEKANVLKPRIIWFQW